MMEIQQTSVSHIGLSNSHGYWQFVCVGIGFCGLLFQKKGEKGEKREKDEVYVC